MTRRLTVLAALLLATPVSAETIAIVDARLMTMTGAGEIGRGTIVIRDGKVVALGTDVAVPAGARVNDEIGNASCGERVSQYVYIYVVACELKKKKQKIT